MQPWIARLLDVGRFNREESLCLYQVQAAPGPPLEDIAGRCFGELGAQYLVKHLPDMGQIVLTPIDGGGGSGALPAAPCMWEKTVAAVRRIRSLHLSRTGARCLTPHLVEGLPWEDVWVTMQQLAQPA